MVAEPPVCRHFLACDRVEISGDGRQVTLVNLIHSFRLLPGAAFPHMIPELWLYAQLANGRGMFNFTVELRAVDDDSLLFPPQSRIIDLSANPLVVRG